MPPLAAIWIASSLQRKIALQFCRELLAMTKGGNASLISALVVDGRTIAKVGRCLGVDRPATEQELRGITRANAASYAHVLRAWPRLSSSLQHWFEAQLTCN